MTRRAFVTGASGFLGRHLVERLVAQGWEVRAAHRASSDVAYFDALGVRGVEVSLYDSRALEEAMGDAPIDAVYHLAADTNVWALGEAQQIRTNVEATRALVRAALARRVTRFMHCSSIAVYGLQDGTIDERASKEGRDAPICYHRTKYQAERVVLDAQVHGLDPVVFNPSHIIGPYDRHNWSRMIRMVDEGSLPGIPPGSGSFCDARDVADAMVAAFTQGGRGENYLFGGEDCDYVTVVHAIGRLLGRRVPARPIPGILMHAIAKAYVARAALTGVKPDVTPETARMVTSHMRCSSAKAERDLGYRTRPTEVSLRDTIAWMQGAGMLRS